MIRVASMIFVATVAFQTGLRSPQQSEHVQVQTQQSQQSQPQTQQQPCSDSPAKDVDAVKKHVRFHLPAKLHQAIVNGTVRIKNTTGVEVDPNAVSTLPAPKQKQNPCDANAAPPTTNR